MMECGTSVLETISRSLKDVVISGLANSLVNEQPRIEAVPLKQKTKDLKAGDIVLPRFIKADECEAGKLLQCVEESVRGKTLPISNVLQDKHSLLSFHLDRPRVIQDVLKEVHTQGVNYGHCNKGEGRPIVLRPSLDGYTDANMTESPMHMRMFYILTHLKRLVEACGYHMLCNERLQGEKASSESQNVNNGTINIEELISSAKVLSDRHKEENREMGDGEVNLKSIIQQGHFYTGKDGFDKNLNKVEVFTPDGKVTDNLKDAASFDNSLDVDNTNNNIIHVVPQAKAFRLQQTILLQAGLSQKEINQSSLTIGPVICKGDVSMEKFQRSRFEQMKEASEMRHGIKCEGPEWTARIDQLSQAGIKIEVLGTALHCPLKMDVQPGSSTENRLGSFVLYNTARLAMILRQFSLSVQNGTYPPLPSLDDVNFGLLREQEEWELLYLYVASFPNTVKESVEVLFPGQGKLAAKIHTHKITNFLISFSKSLSSYYSRYHILGGPESHLLPLMFARLHLVQACHRVICNGLRLLDIQPLDQL